MLQQAPASGDWGTPEQKKAYNDFNREFAEGASCRRLFYLRQQFRVPFNETPQESAANSKLRSVGCLSADSQRQDSVQPGAFTMKEYRIYREVIHTPMAISEADAIAKAARIYGVSPAEAKQIVDKVAEILSNNGWNSTPEMEIKHASDFSPSG